MHVCIIISAEVTFPVMNPRSLCPQASGVVGLKSWLTATVIPFWLSQLDLILEFTCRENNFQPQCFYFRTWGTKFRDRAKRNNFKFTFFSMTTFLYRNNTESIGILSNLVETYRIPVKSNVEIDFRSEEFPKWIRPLENCVISISGHVLWIMTSFEKALWCH